MKVSKKKTLNLFGHIAAIHIKLSPKLNLRPHLFTCIQLQNVTRKEMNHLLKYAPK